MLSKTKVNVTSLLIIILSLVCLGLFSGMSLAQKTGTKSKKKLYVSTIKADGAPAVTAKRVKEGIHLAVFEGFGDLYHVLDDDAVKTMYKQAEAIMASGCDDTSCITQIAEGINADEIIYGNVSQEGPKTAISITNMERKGVSLGTKSIVKLSFFESQFDYAVSETAKKLMNPKHKIDMSKAPVSWEIKLGGIEIKTVKGLDISVIEFKTADEAAARIVEYTKSIVAEGDELFAKGKYPQARSKYLDIMERVKIKLTEEKQAKVKEYVDGVISRIDSTYVMDWKVKIEYIDNKLKSKKEPEIADYENALTEYISLEGDIRKIPDPFTKSRGQLMNAVKDRNDRIYLATASGYEKNGDMLYREFKFTDAIDMYQKANAIAGIIKNDKNKTSVLDRIGRKIKIALKTGEGYLSNRVKSLVDQAEFYNFQDKTEQAKKAMEAARTLIKGPMRSFAALPVYETFNSNAKVMGMEEFDVIAMKEEIWKKAYYVDMKKKGYFVVKEIGGIKFTKIPPAQNSSGEIKRNFSLYGFWMGMFEVTQKQYREIMGENPSHFKGDDLPVEHVSYKDARWFCNKFSEKYNVFARLPNEAEWEYACRAGSTTSYYWGKEIDDNYCWFRGNSGKKTHPVGEKKPNAWGLFDMSGNVWEWCGDWYNNNNKDDMVLRGGSWYDDDSDVGSASRNRFNLYRHSSDTGFRFVVFPN